MLRYHVPMSTRERLHQLIDQLDDEEVAGLLSDLEYRQRAPLAPEDVASVERGLAQSAAGEVVPHSEVLRRFKLAP